MISKVMARYSICAFLAPAIVAAVPWPGPEPTVVIPKADGWNPKPTEGPKLGQMELFKRADENTCGFVSGEGWNSLTCNDPDYICATNDFYGVHGCCHPSSFDSCSLYTQCIASSDLSASCTDNACSNNGYIAKCTDSSYPYCYQWRYVYTDTVMTEYGCANSEWTVSAWRDATDTSDSFSLTGSDSDASSSSRDLNVPMKTVEVTVTAKASDPASTPNTGSLSTGIPIDVETDQPPKKKGSSIGAIIGGAVGGVLGLALIGVLVWWLRRKKKNEAAAASSAPVPNTPAPGVTEYKPVATYDPSMPQQYGSQSPPPAVAPGAGGYYHQESSDMPKAWAHMAPSPATSPAPQYPGLAPVEIGGSQVQATAQQHPAPVPQQQAGQQQMQPMQQQPGHHPHGPVYEAP